MTVFFFAAVEKKEEAEEVEDVSYVFIMMF